MKVILLHEVPGLGKPGELKDVAPGYARNFLLPRQLVTAATQSEITSLNERVAAAQRHAAHQRQTNEELAARVNAIILTFAVRVGQGGRLYGSVTSQNIVDAVQEQESLTLDRRLVQLREPLRSLGEFAIAVRIASGVEPKLTVRIVSSDSLEAQGAEQATSDVAAEADVAVATAAEEAEV